MEKTIKVCRREKRPQKGAIKQEEESGSQVMGRMSGDGWITLSLQQEEEEEEEEEKKRVGRRVGEDHVVRSRDSLRLNLLAEVHPKRDFLGSDLTADS